MTESEKLLASLPAVDAARAAEIATRPVTDAVFSPPIVAGLEPATPKRLPPREVAENFALCFRGQANHLAVQFGGPVYLYGSLLTSHEPGDIDVRLHLEREDMETLFGADPDCGGVEWSPARFLRGREELKQSRRLTRRWCAPRRPRGWGPRIDFQFVISLYSSIEGDGYGLPIFGDDARPRLRLDAVPASYFTAGRGDP